MKAFALLVLLLVGCTDEYEEWTAAPCTSFACEPSWASDCFCTHPLQALRPSGNAFVCECAPGPAWQHRTITRHRFLNTWTQSEWRLTPEPPR